MADSISGFSPPLRDPFAALLLQGRWLLPHTGRPLLAAFGQINGRFPSEILNEKIIFFFLRKKERKGKGKKDENPPESA